jgi:hypothetical protein
MHTQNIDRKNNKQHKLISYYNNINESFFNEYGYPKPTYIVESKKIYSRKKTNLQLVMDYCWLCKIEINSAEFEHNYKLMIPYVSNQKINESDLGFKVYKYVQKKPDNMTTEDYISHWKRLKEVYNGSANVIRSLPKTSLVLDRTSTIAMKSLFLYRYAYKKKRYDILKIIKRVKKTPNTDDIEKLNSFITKHNIHDNLPTSSTFNKNICILVKILKKNGSKRIDSRVKTRTTRKKI